MRAVGKPHTGARPADFLARDHMLQIAEAKPAIGFGDGNAVQAQLAHLRPQLAREPVLAVHLLGQRCDLFVGEARRRLADHLRSFAKLEIEIGGRAHGFS